MSSPWIAAAIAVFAWWVSTGAILYAVHRADDQGAKARRGIVLLTAPVALIGFLMVRGSLEPMTLVWV